MKFQAETCQSLYRLITFITLPFSYFSPNSSVQFHLPYCAGFLSPFSIVGTGHVPVRVQSRASGSCRRMTTALWIPHTYRQRRARSPNLRSSAIEPLRYASRCEVNLDLPDSPSSRRYDIIPCLLLSLRRAGNSDTLLRHAPPQIGEFIGSFEDTLIPKEFADFFI